MSEHRVSEDDLSDEFVRLLALDGNGAVEASLPDGVPLRVIMIGPIKTWWGRMESEEYKQYALWRDAVRAALIYHGCLVYSPHRAWSGAWHESAQFVNNAAIVESDVVINLTPAGVESVGTDAEVRVARQHSKPVFHLPPGGQVEIERLLGHLKDLQE